MADPYAQPAPASASALGEVPDGPVPWLDAIAARGGVVVSSLGDVADADLAAAVFVAVESRDTGLLPALARLTPAAAVALLIVGGEGQAGLDAGADSLSKLSAFDGSIYAVKHGWVAGPRGKPGAVEVTEKVVARALDTAQRDEIDWEIDPDFGYEVAAGVPGLDGDQALALMPRLLYTRHGRVYEHAQLVAQTKHERRSALEAVESLDPRILSALG